MIKVRLHVEDFELSGYDNIKVQTLEDLDKLSKFDNGELDELVIEDVVDYLPSDKAEETVLKLVKLVAKGGKLIVGCSEAYEISKAFTSFNISLMDYNKLVYGSDPNLPKRLGITAISLADLLSKVAGMKILKKRVNKFKFIVEAIRQ